MNLSQEIIGHAYNQVLTQLLTSYEFVLRDNESSVQLRMKTISAIL